MRKHRRRAERDLFETVDHFRVVEDMGGVRGATEKDVLEDPDTGAKYIAKLGRRNNDLEVMTEYAIYLIGRSLGVTVADARIARYRGRLRFLSRYFLETTRAEELVHGFQLFNELYDEGTVLDVLRDEVREQAMFTVQAVKAAFGAHYYHYGAHVEDDLFGGFVSMLTHDALIGVQDRHHENWGVIVQREVGGPAPRFAPLYDSARGLFCNEPDSKLVRYDGTAGQAQIDRYVARGRPLVGFENIDPAETRRVLTHDRLLAAVFWTYPEQRTRIASILEAYDWRRIYSDLTGQLRGLCTRKRTTLILACLRRRLRLIWRRIHGDG